MTRRQISSGSKFEAEIGYSRAIVDGDWMWVSGTTGFNYDAMTISEDVVEQADQTFRNIRAAMEKGGFSLEDVVSVTYIFPVPRTSSHAGRYCANISAKSAPRPPQSLRNSSIRA